MVYNRVRAKPVFHVSDTEAASDFASLLTRVRAGAEVVIEHDAERVAVVHPAKPRVRLLSESLRLAREHGSTATVERQSNSSSNESSARTEFRKRHCLLSVSSRRSRK